MAANTAALAMPYWSVIHGKVMVIIGPTAVGKTALSFALAEHYGTDLISGDAYQIYRHMDIGTAKPTADELARYHHYLIDIAEPDEPYSAARFCDMAGKAIAEVNGKGKVPIVVGGTGLYVQSLLEGYDFQTARMTEADKEAAQARIASLDEGALKDYIVRETDWQPPDWHELLSNTHRLTRLVSAIEQGEGKTFVRAGKAHGLVYDAYVIGLRLPRDVLYARIEERVDAMIAAGWVDEVRHLLDRGIPTDCQAMKPSAIKNWPNTLKDSCPWKKRPYASRRGQDASPSASSLGSNACPTSIGTKKTSTRTKPPCPGRHP